MILAVWVSNDVLSKCLCAHLLKCVFVDIIMISKEWLKMSLKTVRMSIDLPENDHRKIKTLAAVMGVSIKDFVIECINEKIFSENKPNKVTKQALNELNKKKNLHTAEGVDELFKELGL